jgi:hypothetical protein
MEKIRDALDNGEFEQFYHKWIDVLGQRL